MNKPFGMPGPGGSLGQCALCGENFLLAVLLGTKMHSFTVEGCDSKLFAHPECLKKYHGKDWCELPPASPLRAAFERNQSREALIPEAKP